LYRKNLFIRLSEETIKMAAAECGPFWDKKMQSFFKRVNVSGNGLLSKKDFQVLGDRYVSFGKLDAKKADEIRVKLLKVWDDVFSPMAKNDVLDAASYIGALKGCDSKVLTESAKGFYAMWFGVIDLNGNGAIKKEEFTLFLKVFRVEDQKAAEDAFKALDTNKSGKLSKEDFIKNGCEFSLSNDESLPSKYMFGPLI